MITNEKPSNIFYVFHIDVIQGIKSIDEFHKNGRS